MPRGQPDYGLYTETPVASGISDPGEAAARLGSINVYDRRGWTVWMDDFEAPNLKWTPISGAGNPNAVLDISRAWQGIQSVYIATAAVLVPIARIERNFPLLRRGRVGYEFWVQAHAHTPGYCYLWVDHYDGANRSRAILRYDTIAGTITLETLLGLEVVAEDIFMTDEAFYFLPIKLVVDIDTDYYTRLMVGPDEYDISAHQLIPFAPVTDKYLQVRLGVAGSLTEVMHAYIDNFILTQNEP